MHLAAQLGDVPQRRLHRLHELQVRRAVALDAQQQGVVAAVVAHDEARLAQAVAFGHPRDLLRVHEEAARLGGLVGAPHPPLDARVGAPARARPREHRREVAGGEAHQRIVLVEGGDDHLPHLARGHRVAGAGPDDLEDHLLVDDEALARGRLVGDDAQVRRAVGLVGVDPARAHEFAHRRQERLARDERPPDRGGVHAQLVALLEDELEERRRAHVARGPQVRDHARLHLGLPDAARDHRAAHAVQSGLEHAAGGREVVRVAVEDDVARAEARGEQAARGAPEVGAAALRVVDRPGRDEDARQARGRRRVEAAEGQLRPLHVHERGLARDRKPRQRGARADGRRVDVREDPREMGARLAREAHLRGQARHQLALAGGRLARLERVEVLARHDSHRLRRR